MFVVYLDLFSVTWSGSHYSRQPIIEFLSRTIGPKDLFGVMTPSILSDGHHVCAAHGGTLETELRNNLGWGEGDRTTTSLRNAVEARLAGCGVNGLVAAYRKD